MAQDDRPDAKRKAAEDKAARLAAALRANLRRRKAQDKARRADAPDDEAKPGD